MPYRDSVLTFLLKDSLGGNSKTVMVAGKLTLCAQLSKARHENKRCKNLRELVRTHAKHMQTAISEDKLGANWVKALPSLLPIYRERSAKFSC